MKGRLVDISLSLKNKQRITLEVDTDFRESYTKLKDKDISVEIKQYRCRRSLDANAYFHVLVDKIAKEMGLGADEVKRLMVSQYGAIKRDGEGNVIGIKLPASVNVDEIYPYTRWYKDVEENGKSYKCYLVLERSHLLDSKDMAHLIDQTIEEAKLLNIDTDTPEIVALYKSRWGESHV